MIIKDRGNIKWTSLMLVEHRKKLEKLKKSENNKEKPELAKDELKRLDFLLKKALNENLKIKVTYYYKNDFHQWKGEIEKIDSISKQIILSSDEKKEDKKFKIELEDITNIELFNQ